MPRPALLIFTDLDGTLLDHDTYSHAPARPALDRLRAAAIPVILASSKTAAEIAPLRCELGLCAFPAIVENGAGILEPGRAEPPQGGGRYAELRAALDRVPAALRAQYRGFGDWDVAEIARRTGLPETHAARAARRQHSEPGLWSGDDTGKAAFVAALRAQGVTAREGGRFLTLSFGGTKAGRMAEIAARHRTPFIVALGDAANDAEMLEQADMGFVIANPAHPPLPMLRGEPHGHIHRIDTPGPKGWNAAIERVMTEFGM
ncbi:mannosyl-3-phosphoglycerate phosphatase [Rhodovulum bhavnagarense]|uniref:Mannosyl-3-phosphoglycerate phosphatase n=1 Tax=Rhodovulum bhavnagarense TaxID=992286 RepID=A0A4R2RJB0_9RHOB|nr:HAD-IIB family hydrolase [Rhodovulum bhavnagarense]TCP62828.1 mannosyl-3-phosphoglycerate phosphatase [Rhodovulum bhavnagarense]